MSENLNSQQCQNWKSLTGGESQIGSNLVENFENQSGNVDEIRDVSVTAHNMIDPFKPQTVENSYADLFYNESLISDEKLRKCAGVDVLDSSIEPYNVNIPVCDQYSCVTENSAYNHPEDSCGNI